MIWLWLGLFLLNAFYVPARNFYSDYKNDYAERHFRDKVKGGFKKGYDWRAANRRDQLLVDIGLIFLHMLMQHSITCAMFSFARLDHGLKFIIVALTFLAFTVFLALIMIFGQLASVRMIG